MALPPAFVQAVRTKMADGAPIASAVASALKESRSGKCDKCGGTMKDGRCAKCGAHAEPDADDFGGPPDHDEDDMGGRVDGKRISPTF